MELTLTVWIGVPLLGALIGYVTNRIAVKMIFRPIKPVNVLGIKVQGLMPRRQPDLAAKIGSVVGDHLIGHDDIIAALQRVDLESLLAGVLARGLKPKIESFKSMPLVGAFLTDERVAELEQTIVKGILEHRETIYEQLEQAVERGLDIRQIVTDKVAAFPVPKLEQLVLEVASKELRAIEILGGVLGFLIGLLQVLLIGFLG